MVKLSTVDSSACKTGDVTVARFLYVLLYIVLVCILLVLCCSFTEPPRARHAALRVAYALTVSCYVEYKLNGVFVVPVSAAIMLGSVTVRSYVHEPQSDGTLADIMTRMYMVLLTFIIVEQIAVSICKSWISSVKILVLCTFEGFVLGYICQGMFMTQLPSHVGYNICVIYYVIGCHCAERKMGKIDPNQSLMFAARGVIFCVLSRLIATIVPFANVQHVQGPPGTTYGIFDDLDPISTKVVFLEFFRSFYKVPIVLFMNYKSSTVRENIKMD